MPSGAMERMQRVLRRGLVAASGALKGTPTDVLEAHLNVMPLDLHLEQLRHRALARVASLPKTHPLHAHARAAYARPRADHESALHALFRRYRVNPNLLETVDVVRQPPYWTPPFTVDIPRKKEDARLDDDEVRDIAGETRLYSDGSSHDGGVGAAACIIRPDGSTRALRLHLGRDLHYTVHAAESVGLLLATHLLETEAELPRNEVSIGIDNHALLKGANRYRHAYGQWATDEFRKQAAALAARAPLRLVLRWTPGHIGIAGNELVDEHAKRAANGAGESSEQVELPAALLGSLPRSAAAIQQAFNARTRGRAIKRWTSGKTA
jgi:ribonuclease HI